ncbi:Endoplasmic reticulum transmembrane protein 3 [Tieghemiomyces parasiticus]|uniref:Endoplasmic reticulum transmembrane protein n=1 Tax=Tieghemiomyces parasiticus TaxID=78921 RepID=A0A9W8A8J2_9FUNG|nr:Endoplasmic reticulum transmembrane protein 3 [Tieghemiomyces parasiticus]
MPVPNKWRRSLLFVMARSKTVAFIFYWLRVVFAFVFLLFVDAVVRMQRTQTELETEPITDARMESQLHARKFYSQRNVYLTGFTLFLGLILSGTYHLILELLRREDELTNMQKRASDLSKQQATTGTKPDTQLLADLEKTRRELEAACEKANKYDNLKKQADNQHKEYMRLADKYNALESVAREGDLGPDAKKVA